MPARVDTHTESPRTTTPVIVLFANGDGLMPSGSTPDIWCPSHSARPAVVPIHTVSPTTASALIESDGRPSNELTSDHLARSADSTLAPEPEVPTHSRRERSSASTLR